MDADSTTTSGIYRITCTVNGKFYIGSAVNLRKRRYKHFYELRHNTHPNPNLQRAWNKYGPESFTFEVIEFVLIPNLLTAREQYWFDMLKPFGKKGFNLDCVAGSRLGWKPSPEVRAKMSNAQRGNTKNLGKKHTPETRAKMSADRLGNTYSLGKKLSPERSAKLHTGNIGNTYSLGRIDSPETRAKRSASHLGKTISPETRAKMSIAKVSKMKTLIITAPDGTEYHVCGVTAFCREHHLTPATLMNVAKGKHKHHQGWTARFPEMDAS